MPHHLLWMEDIGLGRSCVLHTDMSSCEVGIDMNTGHQNKKKKPPVTDMKFE